MSVFSTSLQGRLWRDDLAELISDELTEQDIRTLHSMLSKLGLDGWLSWMNANLVSAELFLGETSTLSRRRRHHSRDTADEYKSFLLSAYGALWLCALAWQHKRLRDPVEACTNLKHPQAKAAFGLMAWKIWADTEFPYWPFESPDELGNPFLNHSYSSGC
ncbi:hypothetical protein I6M49_22325 [Shewanella algae]|uniref:hypothetical protein n=1 Tax=Shewanella algae TaxID=38313 RepID=UPI001AAC65B6|nr:hypothetical protein [Shewanella algae]MBO2656183.1 hypothetical protein [Shewanella algae]